MAPRLNQNRQTSTKSHGSSNTNDNNDENTTKATRGARPLTDKETNAMLIATVNRNTWGEEHGNIGDAWNDVTEAVNSSESVTRKFTTAVVKKKVNDCIDLHEGRKPPRTHFSNSETGIYHSQIDLIRGLKETAERKKGQEAAEKTNRAARNEREGHLARQAALTTFTQGINNPSPHPQSSPTDSHADPESGESKSDEPSSGNQAACSPRPTQHSDPLFEALDKATEMENTRHETLLMAIAENSEHLKELAQGMQEAARAQVESNQLMRELISQNRNQQAAETHKRPCDEVTTPEKVPRKRVTRARAHAAP